MSFAEFFQSNLILFVAAIGLFAYLMATEALGMTLKNLTLSTSVLTQKVNAGATLIDLRRAEDYAAGHITGAKNIPFDTLSDNIGALNKNSDIVVYCYRGQSSARAVKQLQKAGFAQVMHLGGGLDTWSRENLPLVKA